MPVSTSLFVCRALRATTEGNPLSEDLIPTLWSPAAPAGQVQLEPDAGPLEGKIPDLKSITAMPRPRHNTTTRAVSATLAVRLHNPLISGRRNTFHRQTFEAREQLPVRRLISHN